MFKDISKVLLITDLDGTLLPHSKVLSQKDIDAISKFVSSGGNFSVATGRPLESVTLYFEQLNISAPIILYNGSAIYDVNHKKYLWSKYLSENCKELISDVLNKFSNASAEILTTEGIFALQINDTEKYHISITNTEPIQCTLDEIKGDWLKALFAVEPEEMDELISYIDKEKYSDLSFVQSCRFFYEVLPFNISKGSALKILKNKCDYNSHTIVAVGDYYNDIEMLKIADVGVATANANDDVKDIADIVLDKTCDENAIANLIEYIFSQCT